MRVSEHIAGSTSLTFAHADTRRLLRHWNDIPGICRKKNEEMREFGDRLKETSGMITSVTEKPKVDGGAVSDPTASTVQKMHALEREYERFVGDCAEDVKRLLRLKADIDEALEDLSPIERRVIGYRYEKGYSWARVTLQLGVSESRAREIEWSALEKIERKITITKKE